ncbi:MAG: hypothetical protein IT372_14125 [Polyangiaceae bacterium]|nr:hypothetical protein [Polyangiaceae bacterium]
MKRLSTFVIALLAISAPVLSGAEPRPAAVPARPAPRGKAPPAPLDGATYDYELDPKAAGKPELSWLGRAFVHRLAASSPDRPLPVLVFLHGINAELIKYRWMGGGREGDVRRIVAELIESGRIPPILVAAPSAVLPAATAVARTSWPAFDLQRFLDLTAERLRGVATLDRARVIVAGHSGGGCNKDGGISTAARAARPVHAALVIDGCMDPDMAPPLAAAPPTTHVIVSWQPLTWTKRPVRDFERAFRREVAARPPAPGVLREVEQLRPEEPSPHDAMVSLVLQRWLPPLLSPDAAPDLPCVSP